MVTKLKRNIAFILLIVLGMTTFCLGDSLLINMTNNASPSATDYVYEAIGSGTNYSDVKLLLGTLKSWQEQNINWNNVVLGSDKAINWQDFPATGLMKFNGSSAPIAATAGTDYQQALNILAGTYVNGDVCTYASSGTLLNCNTTAGAGTVTSVSVATANGFSGTVANATTTPAITIIAGAIVPTTVNGLTISTSTGTLTIPNGVTDTGTPSSSTLAGLSIAETFTATQTISAANLATDTTTGMDIGTATNQKIGFYNVTPIIQPSGDIITALTNDGLIATPTITQNDVINLTTSSLPTFAGVAATAPITITSTSATSFSVGSNGSTNPVLNIDDSVSSQVDGITIQGKVAGNGPQITATSTATNTPFIISSKGSGSLTLESPSGTVLLRPVNSIVVTANSSVVTISPSTKSSGATSNFILNGAADTGLTASTNETEFLINLAQTKTHANGAITTETHFLMNAPTDAFTSSASTITDDASMSINSPPVGGTNATITNAHGLLIQSGVLANTTNGYGLTVNSPSGATSNYSAQFIGSSSAIATHITSTGHVEDRGTAPALTSCGTSPSIVGDDNSFTITVGTVAATGCTATFTNAWTNTPTCTVTNQSMSITSALSYTVSTTAVVISQSTGLVGDVLNVVCRGYYTS